MISLLCVAGIVALFVAALPGSLPPAAAPEISELPAPSPPVAREVSPLESRSAGPVVTGSAAAVTARLGGSLQGRVYAPYGDPQGGVEVVLVDAEDVALDRAVADEGGHYAVADGSLRGVAVVVNDHPRGVVWTRTLAPLAPGEVRTFDIHLGSLREVVGWVLDMRGDPVPGAGVVLISEVTSSRWVAMSDPGGGFHFPEAPDTPLRVDATDVALGHASARLAATGASRREVTLVLEPVGWIEVARPSSAPGVREPAAEVLVLGRDRRLHGEDPPDLDDELGAMSLDRDLDDAERALFAALEAELLSFDPAQPQASVERLLRGALTTQIASAGELAPPHVVDWVGEIEPFVEAMAQELIADERAMAEIAAVAKLVQGGTPLMEAMALTDGARHDEPADVTPYDFDGDGAYDADFGSPHPAPAGSDPLVRASLVARGTTGVAIPVRGGFSYEVMLEAAPGAAPRPCGVVFVAAGERVTLPCGAPGGAARISGRVVDAAGRPLSGMRVAAVAGIVNSATTTDPDGAFVVPIEGLDASTLGSLEVSDPGGHFMTAARRNLNVVPGSELPVGVVVVRTAEERSAAQSVGGIGALLGFDELGVRVVDAPLDAPVALAGLEPSDAIVGVDGESVGRLAIDEIRLMLRGDPGTPVELRVRTLGGELYDVTVDRMPCESLPAGCLEDGTEAATWR